MDHTIEHNLMARYTNSKNTALKFFHMLTIWHSRNDWNDLTLSFDYLSAITFFSQREIENSNLVCTAQ